jgi:flagellar FliL protein
MVMADENKVAAKPEGKKTTNLVIIGLFAFLITIIIAATFLVVILRNPSNAAAVKKAVAVKTDVKKKDQIGVVIPITPDIIVNIMSAGGERYLKVNLVMEINTVKGKEKAAKAVQEEITSRIPQFRDAIISILRTKTKEEIDEKEGKDLIRKEIINTINNFLISGKIKNIYFQDFVIQ